LTVSTTSLSPGGLTQFRRCVVWSCNEWLCMKIRRCFAFGELALWLHFEFVECSRWSVLTSKPCRTRFMSLFVLMRAMRLLDEADC
jgi:hypothetical protein